MEGRRSGVEEGSRSEVRGQRLEVKRSDHLTGFDGWVGPLLEGREKWRTPSCFSAGDSISCDGMPGADVGHPPGIFEGSKAGVWQGYDKPDAAGPYAFDVINSVGKTSGTLKFMAQQENGYQYDQGSVNGFTDATADPLEAIKDRPPSFIDYTAKDQDPSQFVPTQIYELGNSLAAITHKPLPQGPPKSASDPTNPEWGRKLSDCYNNKIGGGQ